MGISKISNRNSPSWVSERLRGFLSGMGSLKSLICRMMGDVDDDESEMI